MKKSVLVLVLLIGIAALIFAFLAVWPYFTQSNIISGLSPEDTAVRYVKEISEASFQIDPDTVEAIQNAEVNGAFLVLVQYSGSSIEDGAKLCEMVVEVRKVRKSHWMVKSGAGLCHEVQDSSQKIPITVVSNYGVSGPLLSSYSTVFGYIRNDEIEKILITWEDGLVQSANLAGRTYLATREGDFYIAKIDAFNKFGEIIYTS